MPSHERAEPLFTISHGSSFKQILLICYGEESLLVGNAADPSCPAPVWKSSSDSSLRFSLSIGSHRIAASSNASPYQSWKHCSNMRKRPVKALRTSPGNVISRRMYCSMNLTYSAKVPERTTMAHPSWSLIVLPSRYPSLTPRYCGLIDSQGKGSEFSPSSVPSKSS